MMNILIIKLSAIGDVVQTLPALEAIKSVYPDSRISWIVEEAAAGILEGHPLIDTLLVSRRKTWLRMLKNPLTFLQGMSQIIRFIAQLRTDRYDIAIDFQGLFKSGMLIGMARAGRKIGFDKTREGSSFFLNERLPAYDIEKHALERYLDIARHLGAHSLSYRCSLPVEKEIVSIRSRLKPIVTEGKPVIAVNPVARWRTKLWSEAKFAELADRIVEQYGALVIFTGSSDDRDVIERIVSLMNQRGTNWAGTTTLKELAALASVADVFITTDTGPMHLAAAAGSRVVALFGPTAPWRTGPYGPLHRVIRTGIDCSPCFQRECGIGIKCMEGITVDEVMQRIEIGRSGR